MTVATNSYFASGERAGTRSCDETRSVARLREVEVPVTLESIRKTPYRAALGFTLNNRADQIY